MADTTGRLDGLAALAPHERLDEGARSFFPASQQRRERNRLDFVPNPGARQLDFVPRTMQPSRAMGGEVRGGYPSMHFDSTPPHSNPLVFAAAPQEGTSSIGAEAVSRRPTEPMNFGSSIFGMPPLVGTDTLGGLQHLCAEESQTQPMMSHFASFNSSWMKSSNPSSGGTIGSTRIPHGRGDPINEQDPSEPMLAAKIRAQAYGSDLDAKVRKQDEDVDPHWGSEVERALPLLFTLFCFVIFAIPIWLTYTIGTDPEVIYWISDALWIVVFLPGLYLITHGVHVSIGRPSRLMITLCLCGSCTLLLIVSDVVLMQAYTLANKFVAKDCNSFVQKRELEAQWELAQTFYASCMVKTADVSLLSFEQAVNTYRIEDCEGYKDQAAVNHGWSYLGKLEKQYSCSGWCSFKPALWVGSATKDSCAATVADVLYNKVQWTMLQVVVYTIICFGFVAFTLIVGGTLLRSQGVKW